MGRIRWGAVALACALLLAVPTGASARAFLELDGIPGESQVRGFENQIVIDSFQLGISRSKDKSASFSDFVVTKELDRASPELMLRAANGATIPTARVRLTRSSGDGERTVLRYCFTGVRVTGYSQSSGGDLPVESISFDYATLVQSYSQQDPAGGAGGVFAAGWDVIRNLEFGAACD